MPNIVTLCDAVRVHIKRMQFFSQMVSHVPSIANPTGGSQRSASICLQPGIPSYALEDPISF